MRRLDWGLLLALAIALIAAAPFLTRPGLPRRTDAELHVYRAAELGHALRAGVLYPRWAPDFYFGYGYPIFNYYAPLTYYLANAFSLLPGLDVVGGVKAVFVLGFVLASLGTYLLGRELFGPAAGVLAAASFTLAPYVVFVDPHARGVLAEHFALCLLPLVFYAFRRLMSGVGGREALGASVLTLAALVFSHNLLGLVVSGLVLAYWAWEVVCKTGRGRAGWGLLALALAAALVAFFWLPAVLERGAVKLDVTGPGHFDFHEHFLSLYELLAPSPVLDMGAMAPRYRFNLGLAQWLLALLALGPLLDFRVEAEGGATSPPLAGGTEGGTLLYFFLAGLVLVVLMLPASTGIWEQVPLMPYLQFPWRLLGPANLMLAVCAGAGVTVLPEGPRWRAPAVALALAVILLLALPVLYPPMWAPDFGGTAPEDIIFWEMRGNALGTTSTGDFVPVGAVQAPIFPQGTLVDSYTQLGPIDRVNRAVLPEGASVEIVEQEALRDLFWVSTPERFTLRLYLFYFPGWHVYVDGEEAQIEVAGPEGFITLWVPEGEHEVLVRFEDTPPRTAGWAISAAGLGMLVVALGMMESGQGGSIRLEGKGRRVPGNQRVHFMQRRSWLWLGGVLLLFVGLKNGVIDRRDDWLRYTSAPGQAWAAQHERRATFYRGGSGQVELLGYDLPCPRVRSGEAFPVVLYWHALAPLDENYQSFVHLARPLHILWGQEDHLNPGDLPTKLWPLDKYVWDEYAIHVLPGTPPGEYALNVGLYSMAGEYRLQRRDESGEVSGDSLVIASVQVERPRRQPQVAELGMTHGVTVTFPEAGVTLLGYEQLYPKVKLPGTWPLTLFWRADRDHPAARVRDLVLLDAAGEEVYRWSGPPADYAFENWRAGEIVRDPLVFASESPVSLFTDRYYFGVVVSTDRPVPPEGVIDPYVHLGDVKFRVKENE
jgi:hypothetical protein